MTIVNDNYDDPLLKTVNNNPNNILKLIFKKLKLTEIIIDFFFQKQSLKNDSFFCFSKVQHEWFVFKNYSFFLKTKRSFFEKKTETNWKTIVFWSFLKTINNPRHKLVYISYICIRLMSGTYGPWIDKLNDTQAPIPIQYIIQIIQ